MRKIYPILIALVLALPLAATANAQVAVGVGVGPAVAYAPDAYGPPVCDWGYYSYYPYACAPYGYYGPGWFAGGLFIGAGPWYHGAEHFYGHVDHHFDYRKGYHGPMPARGAAPAEHRQEFHGNAMHDVHGHEAPRGHR